MESATSGGGGGGGAACLLPAWVRRRRSVSSPPHPWARKNGRKKGEEEEEERRLRQQVANRRLLFISLPLPAWDQDRGMEKRNPAATACEFLCSCSKEEKEGERRAIPIPETRKKDISPPKRPCRLSTLPRGTERIKSLGSWGLRVWSQCC